MIDQQQNNQAINPQLIRGQKYQGNSSTSLIMQQIDVDNSAKQRNVEREEVKAGCGLLQFKRDFLNLYSYGDCNDKILLVCGIIIGLSSGLFFPLFTYFWGKQIDNANINYNQMESVLTESLKRYIIIISIGIGAFIINAISFSLWKLLSVSIAKKFRMKYLSAFSSKSVEWIDKQNLYELSCRFKDNCMTIERAIGDKVALFYNLNGVMMTGSIIALTVRWTFTLYLFALLPIAMGILGGFIYISVKKRLLQKQFYKSADAQVSESMALIRTVKMLTAEEQQSKLYRQKLDEYSDKVKNEPLKLGIATGLFYFVQYLMYGIGYIYALQCVSGTSACPISVTGSHYTSGQFLTVFFQLFLCSYNFLQLGANFEAIKSAIESSKEIFIFVKEAENEKQIRESKESIRDDLKIGDIQLKNVHFSYPSNAQKPIFEGVSIRFLRNKFNAIAGPTGSGKSTVVQLILKNYNANAGQLLIDGVEISKLSPGFILNRVGYVGQEPILFSGTIRDNIKVGKESASDQEIMVVLKSVNLEEFVQSLPENLDFDIGFGGSKLSGGQKQRIAIARALIRKPQLLILDEATSALDRKSEKIIQETIKNVLTEGVNMTVICIAHRMKTIEKADRIWFIEDGKVKEEGSFSEISAFKNASLQQQQAQQKVNISKETSLMKKKTSTLIQKTEEAINSPTIFMRLFSLIEDKKLYIFAQIAAILNGLNHPFGCLLLCYFYDTALLLYNEGNSSNWCKNSLNKLACQDSLDQKHDEAVKYLFGLIGFSFYAFIPYFLQVIIMAKIQNRLSYTLRDSVFSKLLQLPMRWHQSSQNQGGKIQQRCSIDARQMGGLLTNYIPILTANFFTILGSMIIPLCYDWQLGLLSLFITPLIAISAYLSMIFVGGYNDQTLHRYEIPNQLANQIILSIKTILSFHNQATMLKKYNDLITQPQSQSLKKGAKIGMLFGSSSMILIVSVGTLIYAGARILAVQSTPDSLAFVVTFTLPIWCGWLAGNSFFFAANASAGKKSAENIFRLLDTKGEEKFEKINKGTLISPQPKSIKGKIQFINVSYNHIKDGVSIPILSNVSFTVEAGQKVALVGPSGCGKSTLLQLLQRNYNYEGQILLDGVNICEYDLRSYRSYFGVVNQEPSLFMGTVRSNITCGKESISEQRLTEACQQSCAFSQRSKDEKSLDRNHNIAEFIKKSVGPKGSNISGGEKQRTAIARALLREPRIFVLDEGTSALDRETEKTVQQNLDSYFKGCTSINVAHRLETIENCDRIFLMKDGYLLEQGTFKQLLKKRSSFQKFVKGQL